MRYLLAATALTMGFIPMASAQDAALVIGNENYRNASDISAADNALDAVDALQGAGFVVQKGGDLTAGEMRDLIARHYGDTERPGRSVLLLAGHFVHAGAETWLVGVDADEPTLATVDADGLSLTTVLAIAAERPGGALVLLGTEDRRITLGRGLDPGIGLLAIPQGVTVIEGDAGELAEFAENVVPEPGQTLAALARQVGDMTVQGYLGDLDPFLPLADTSVAGPPPAPAPESESAAEVEDALWQTARNTNTRIGYESYLRRYPSGRYASEARKVIAALSDPAASARAGEEALNLSRDQRREIQRDLSILDLDPRGIDGLFGPGSRRAISEWQRRDGEEATGYITASQITALAKQADKRAAELEAEAAERQAEQDRQDRQYWEQTGKAGDEPGLRTYLKRYPDGLFAELAQERLKVFDDARHQQAQAVDRAAWDEAIRVNSAASYRSYLNAHPRGAFAEEAQQRLAELTADVGQQEEISRAKRAEDALGLNPALSRVLEQRLDAQGLKPGKVDGVFDKDTRRAIRRYQRARNLPVTGYFNQQTVARLLVDSL